MEHQSHYDTVSNAINALRQQGYVDDFKLDGDFLRNASSEVHCNDFTIVDVYRYEGNSDPSDEAAVYAIESNAGHKGILVTGYGISADSLSAKMLEKLSIR
ncbi:hypothetical protein DYBT9275_05610 [Dyadobacter sp. CECT 9275]|uniref:Phosphoribosylpyrophosphate synthetase n=1 Tax=Dyadobacter helix TaxID=2822344 RepID=A0A916JK84_9BACT|nr:hypothetical protein [Dyadobacter sp. CECT 9275]CAG5016690.1 hypothetical protein DYBT9275_05610 [Dyadobacter sp. CECT 9275]